MNLLNMASSLFPLEYLQLQNKTETLMPASPRISYLPGKMLQTPGTQGLLIANSPQVQEHFPHLSPS